MLCKNINLNETGLFYNLSECYHISADYIYVET